MRRGIVPAMPFTEWERHRHSVDADATLARMDFLEDLAQLAAEAETDRERDCLANRYRQLLGFHPDQRDAVRQTLEHVQQEGNRPVPDVSAWCSPGGKFLLAAGPAFSYYKLRRPRAGALTSDVRRAWSVFLKEHRCSG